MGEQAEGEVQAPVSAPFSTVGVKRSRARRGMTECELLVSAALQNQKSTKLKQQIPDIATGLSEEVYECLIDVCTIFSMKVRPRMCFLSTY
jgi:hypothetical protein